MIYTGMSFWPSYYRHGIWYWAEMEQEFWFDNWWLPTIVELRGQTNANETS